MFRGISFSGNFFQSMVLASTVTSMVIMAVGNNIGAGFGIIGAIAKLCEEEELDQKQFQALIDAYIYREQEPLRDEVFKCLDNRPCVLQARTIGEHIIAKMKEFVEVFVKGMVA